MMMKSVGASTSSVNRITEPAITHLPQAGSDPELFRFREHFNAESNTKIGCSSGNTTSELFESSNGSTQFFYSGLAKLRMLKVLTTSVPQHLELGNQFWTSRILNSRLQADS